MFAQCPHLVLFINPHGMSSQSSDFSFITDKRSRINCKSWLELKINWMERTDQRDQDPRQQSNSQRFLGQGSLVPDWALGLLIDILSTECSGIYVIFKTYHWVPWEQFHSPQQTFLGSRLFVTSTRESLFMSISCHISSSKESLTSWMYRKCNNSLRF